MSVSSTPGGRASSVVRGVSLPQLAAEGSGSVPTVPVVTGLIATATRDSTSTASTVDRRALLADALGKLSQAGFVQNVAPVEGVVSMQRVWQGPEEDSVVVDSVTIHIRDQGLAVREGVVDGAPIWGPMRGPWSDLVAVVLALPPPEEFVMVLAEGPSVSGAALPGGLS